jgi:hypothetical protein
MLLQIVLQPLLVPMSSNNYLTRKKGNRSEVCPMVSLTDHHGLDVKTHVSHSGGRFSPRQRHHVSPLAPSNRTAQAYPYQTQLKPKADKAKVLAGNVGDYLW